MGKMVIQRKFLTVQSPNCARIDSKVCVRPLIKIAVKCKQDKICRTGKFSAALVCGIKVCSISQNI